MDFTLSIYKYFLQSFISKGYSLITFSGFLNSKNDINDRSIIILRHDIDHFPKESLKIAEIENSFGIKASYYFRIIPKIYNKNIIQKVSDLGHEIGYQYEDVDLMRKKLKIKSKRDEEKLIDIAYKSFCKNLDEMREIYPIKTICSHGSPISPYDNKIVWNKYNYKKLDIIGDPSFDIDWNNMAYFTDTGRRWNSFNVNVRDKVKSNYKFDFRSTQDIINNIDILPKKIMINIHTHRWFDPNIMWVQELIFQNFKNVIKYFLVKKRQILMTNNYS